MTFQLFTVINVVKFVISRVRSVGCSADRCWEWCQWFKWWVTLFPCSFQHNRTTITMRQWYIRIRVVISVRSLVQRQNKLSACMWHEYTVTYSGFSIDDGTLLHSKSKYTTVKHSRQLFEHTYTSDPHGLGTLIPIEFFQQDILWQPSNTHSHSCSQKASKYTSGQSIVGLSVRLHTTTAPRRIVHH
jgi:hypothetical protein